MDETVHTYAMAENVLDIVVALYSFTSTNDQELSFEKGDRLEILDRPPSDPEWLKARNNQGQTGLIPKNYVQVSLPLLCRFIHEVLRFINGVSFIGTERILDAAFRQRYVERRFSRIERLVYRETVFRRQDLVLREYIARSMRHVTK